MTRDLVPELHDIGKLTDLWPSSKRHNFEEFDFAGHHISPTTGTWHGILEHHCTDEPRDVRGYLQYPTRPDTFLCCLADSLASAVSRGRLPEGEERATNGSDTIQKIWRFPSAESFSFVEAAVAARFIQTDPSAEEFFRRFDEQLTRRAEETRYPITSLRTHAKLTGKFFRILQSFPLNEAELGSKTRDAIRQALTRAQNQWRLTVAKCKPAPLMKPFRSRDLGVFSLLVKTIHELQSRFPDNILFSTPEAILVMSGEEAVLRDIQDLFTSRGFWLEISSASRKLDEFRKHDLLTTLGPGTRTANDFPSLPSQIKPPLCEACGMAPAAKVWPEREIADELCEQCAAIREEGKSLTKLASWSNEKVAWVHIKLDFDRLLTEALPESCAKYMGISLKQADIRFSLVAEFQLDYDAFLKAVETALLSHFRDPNVERLLPGLFCLKLETHRDILKVLRLFNEEIARFFPRFRDVQSSPIRLGVSTSAAKFPFFEHWRILENPEAEVLVNLIGRGEMKTSLKALPELLRVSTLPNRSALHNLAQVARISEDLAKLKMHDRADSDQPSYRRLRELLPFGMSYQSILTLAKIVGD